LLGRLKTATATRRTCCSTPSKWRNLMGIIAAHWVWMREGAACGRSMTLAGVDHEVEGSHALIGADISSAPRGRHHCHAVAATTRTPSAVRCSHPGRDLRHPECEPARTVRDHRAVPQAASSSSSRSAPRSRASRTALPFSWRELRVVVEPAKISRPRRHPGQGHGERIEKEMRYPGQIKVSVIRETRAVEYAK